MPIKYGTFETNITQRELSLILPEAYKIVNSGSSVSALSGTTLHTLSFVKQNTNPGYCMVGSDDGTRYIGVAFFDKTQRVWLVGGDAITLFLDGSPEIVSRLGFVYDSATGNVTHPMIGDHVLFTLT